MFNLKKVVAIIVTAVSLMSISSLTFAVESAESPKLASASNVTNALEPTVVNTAFNLSNPEQQQYSEIINGQKITVVVGQAKAQPRPRKDYDLDEGEGFWTRDIYTNTGIFNYGYTVYYEIKSDGLVSIYDVYDEYVSGISLDISSADIKIVRANETSILTEL